MDLSVKHMHFAGVLAILAQKENETLNFIQKKKLHTNY